MNLHSSGRAGRILEQLLPRLLLESALNPPEIYQKYEDAICEIERIDCVAVSAQLVELARYMFDEEEARRKRLETNAGQLLGPLGVVGALSITLTSVLLTRFSHSVRGIVILLLAHSVAFVYIVAAFVLCIQVFSMESRSYLDPTDLTFGRAVDADEFRLKVATKLLRYTTSNYRINNRQVNRLIVARRLFLNGLVALLLAGLLLSWFLIGNSFANRVPVENVDHFRSPTPSEFDLRLDGRYASRQLLSAQNGRDS